jgi:hypothetical protein
VLVTLEVALGLMQTALAGGFLGGDYGALDLHATNASILGVVCLAQLVSAVLLWKPGRGPGWPALWTAVLFLAEGGQISLGYARVLAVHVPLGVAIVVALVLMARWAWRPLPEAVQA